MSTSRIAAVLAVLAVSVGGGAALAGCGASDIPGVSDAKTTLDNATKDAQKQLDQAEQDLKTQDGLTASQKAELQKQITAAKKQLEDAKKKLNDALGD